MALVFVLLCALTNFMAKTVDFVELIQGVSVQIYPGVLIVVVIIIVSHLSFERKDSFA